MTKHDPRSLEILGIFIQVGVRSEMAELMRRHVDPDVPLNGTDDLTCKCIWVLAPTMVCNKQVSVAITTKARQDMVAIPVDPSGYILWNLRRNVFLFVLRFCCRNLR